MARIEKIRGHPGPNQVFVIDKTGLTALYLNAGQWLIEDPKFVNWELGTSGFHSFHLYGPGMKLHPSTDMSLPACCPWWLRYVTCRPVGRLSKSRQTTSSDFILTTL